MTKRKVVVTVKSEAELAALGPGNFEVVWSTGIINIKDTAVTYDDGFPMGIRRLSDGDS